MKIIILSIVLFFAVNVTGIYAFGGGHDSLLFDGESGIKQVQAHSEDCPVKVRYASGKNNGFKHVERIVTDCSGKEIETLQLRESGQLNKDDILYLGEEVSTGADGIVELEIWDGAILRMAPNTTIEITKEFCDTRSIFQKYGNVWVKMKHLLGGGKFEISTKCAVDGNRGTEYTVEATSEITVTRVYEGSVEVTPRGLGDSKNVDDAGKEMEKLSEDLQNGKITPEEFTQKVQQYSNSMEEKSKGMNSVVVEAGNMVTVTDAMGNVEPIPSSDFHWFEDANFYK